MTAPKNPALDAILETMVDGVITIDKTGLIQRYNTACETIFGYKHSEVQGQNVKMLMPDNYRQDHDQYITDYQHSGEAKIIGIGREVSGKRKNGDIFPMYLSVGENKGGGEGGYVGIIRDLTEKAARDAEHNRIQQEYFHLSRVAAMNQMGTAIAHELNQPLAAIMNYVQAAKATLNTGKDVDREAINQMMSKSSEQVDRAAKTLARLRRFIQTGDVEKEKADVLSVIKTSVELSVLSFKALGVTIKYEFEKDLPDILMSDVQIQQVLVNLIRNACEAMERSPDKILRISASLPERNTLLIGVIDTGAGISDVRLKMLFEPFSSDKKDGLGVGLSISQSIIASHDGRLWGEQNEAGGSAFYFTLPAKG